MSAIRLERAGVSFSIGGQSGPVTLEVRTHHDTIAALRGGQVSFELLNGITLAQAKKLVDVLNEHLVTVLVSTSSDDQRGDLRKVSAASEVASRL
jgi:hypothetical protein